MFNISKRVYIYIYIKERIIFQYVIQDFKKKEYLLKVENFLRIFQQASFQK